jgi:hypothetical protein
MGDFGARLVLYLVGAMSALEALMVTTISGRHLAPARNIKMR